MRPTTIVLDHERSVCGLRKASRLYAHSWTKPHLFTSYLRLENDILVENEIMTETFVCANSVTKSSFNRRSLPLASFLLQTDIYAFKFHLHDVILCSMPRSISSVEHISTDVRADESFNAAPTEPLKMIDYYRR